MTSLPHSAPVMAAESPLLAETVALGIVPTPRPFLGKTGTVVIGSPVSALGALLQAGISPGDALLCWSAAGNALLSTLDRYQNHMSLVFAPRQGGEMVIGRRQLTCPADGVAPWWLLAAGQLIEADETARRVADALAECVGSETYMSLPDVLALTADLQRFLRLDIGDTAGIPPVFTKARLGMAIEAIDRLQADVSQQVEDLAKITEAREQAELELARLREKVTEQSILKGQLEALMEAHHTLKQAQEMRENVLGAQLINDLSEQRRLRELLRRLEDWGRTLQADVERLRDELDKVYGSKSWKLTSPLRSLRLKKPTA